MAAPKLRGDNKKFALEYCCNHMNGVRAALYVWPDLSYGSAATKAHTLLKKPEIIAYINEYYESSVMSLNEALARTSLIARADFGDFISETTDGESAYLDFDKARELGLTSLIKEITEQRTVSKDGDTRTEIKVKLHNALDALKEVLKVHGAIKDRLELSTAPGANVTIYLPDNGRTATRD